MSIWSWALFPLLLATNPDLSPAETPTPSLTVSYDQARHTVNVANHEHAPYTLAFSFPEFENAEVNCDRPCFKVAEPGQQGPLLVFRRKVSDRPWKARYEYHYRIGDYRAKPDVRHVYELPYAPGAGFKIAQGYNGNFTHQGANRYALDFLMPEGTPIHAARAGKVVWVVNHFREGGPADRFRQRANQVQVLHADGSLGAYFHLRFKGAIVKPGQPIKVGQVLGYSGNTGYSSRPHLHFQVHFNHTGRDLRSMPTLFRTQAGPALLKTGETHVR